MLIIGADTVRELLPMPDCIDAMEQAMRAVSNGAVHMPERLVMALPDGESHFFTPGKDIASLDLNEFLTGPGREFAECLGGDIELLPGTGLFAVCNRPAAPPWSPFRGARGGSSTASRALAAVWHSSTTPRTRR